MQIKTSTVSEVVSSIKRSLESEFVDLTVVGEVTNLSHSSAGHYYFNLSDDNSSISCALFKMDAFKNPAIRKIKNGDKVLLRGPISLYAKRGTFQIICKRILPYGKGDLKAQYEFLKEKLRSQGFFDDENKKQIPVLPKKIAVITAIRGAALQDFLNIIKRRSLWFDIVIVPSIVQGDTCPRSIIKALNNIEKAEGVDLVVITRGGGSSEDLWGFNDEELVKRVYNFKIPIISAIGHQVDYTLLDYVSDLRCETPSAAAEIISQEQTKLNSRLTRCTRELNSLFRLFKSSLTERLEKVNPLQFAFSLQKKFRQNEIMLEKIKFFEKADPLDINSSQRYLDELIERAKSVLIKKYDEKNQKIILFEKLLGSLDPTKVLGRGYTYIKTNSGKVLSSLREFDSIDKDEIMNIQFSDGNGQVKKVKS